MRAAEYSVHHGRFPSKHIHIDRCTLLCRLQFGLLHCAGAENEVHIHQVLGLITGVGLLKSFQKIIRTFTIFLFNLLHNLLLRHAPQRREVSACGKLVQGSAYHHRNVLALHRSLRVERLCWQHIAIYRGSPAKDKRSHSFFISLYTHFGNGLFACGKQFVVRYFL